MSKLFFFIARLPCPALPYPSLSQAATLERPRESEEQGEEEVLGLGIPAAEGAEEDIDQHHGAGLRGWGLSGWATDIERRKLGWTNKEWKEFTTGLRQPWTARGHAGLDGNGDKQVCRICRVSGGVQQCVAGWDLLTVPLTVLLTVSLKSPAGPGPGGLLSWCGFVRVPLTAVL